MKKLTMLAAASALALGTAAQAGQLELKLKNINGGAGSNPANDAIDTATGVTTVDRPSYVLGTILITDDTDPHADPIATIGKIKSTGMALAAERVVSEEHPLEAHFELNATRFDTDGILTETLPDEFLLTVEVSGAVWKTQLNGEDLIRNGMMGEGDLDADVLGGTGAEGTTTAEILVNNIPGNGNQTDFGLLLPLRITGGDNDILTPCDPVQVQVQAFSTVGFGGPSALGAPDVTTIMTCEDSFGFTANGGVAKVDFQVDFKGFLDDFHNPTDSVTIGYITPAIWNNVFDPKATDFDSEIGVGLDRNVDITDIESYNITFQFLDLTGIEEVNLLDAPDGSVFASAVLNRDANTATFVIDNMSDLPSILQENIIPGDIDHDGDDENTLVEQLATAHVQLVAFGPDVDKFEKVETIDPKGDVVITKVPTGNGAIEHQPISISENFLRLNAPCKERDGVTIVGGVANAKAPKFICEIPLPTGPFAELTLTGQNFGPFDWVLQGPSQNFWRVSHLPLVDGHGNPLTELKGLLTLKNSAGNGTTTGAEFDGAYKFSLPFDPTVRDRGMNGVYLLGTTRVNQILAENGMPANFGSTDISWTFFVNSVPGSGETADLFKFSENFKIDVDRLLLSPDGTFTEYGDNANDSNSRHSVSGDTGRFGPKVPLKLKTEGFTSGE